MFRNLLFVIFCSFCIVVCAQNSDDIIRITKGAKDIYKVGDELTLELHVTMPEEICNDGMENAKVYLSGFELLEDWPWTHDNKNHWSKEIKLKVIENKKGQSKITVFRKADKGSFYSQLKLDVNDNNSH